MIVEGEKDLIPEPSGQEEDPRLSKKTGGGKTKFSYLDFDNVNTEKSSATTGKILVNFINDPSLHLHICFRVVKNIRRNPGVNSR